MDGKGLIMSKTFWVNVIGLAGMCLTASGMLVQETWLPYEAAALAIMNVLLRLVTGEPITGLK